MAKSPASTPNATTADAKKARASATRSARTTKAKVEDAAEKTAAAASASVKAKADTIREEAQRKAGEIGDEVSRMYNQASERAVDAARQGKTRAAEGLESLSRIIGGSAESVDDRFGTQYGDFARNAASKVSELAGSLEQTDIDEMVDATREFVRKSPAVAIGSAAVVGFMLARLLSGKRDA